MRPIARLLAVLGVMLVSCKGELSAKDIAEWKQRGEKRRLAAALSNQKIPLPIRLHAARALVELAADQEFAVAMKKLDAAAVARVALHLAPALDRLLGDKDLRRQILAKDFLARLILLGDRRTADRAGPHLIQWLAADLGNRIKLGKVSSVELLKKLGTRALPALHGLLRKGNDLLRVAKIIRAIGDRAGRRHAIDLVYRVARSQAPNVPTRTLRALFALGGARSARRLSRLMGSAKLSLKSRRVAAEELRALGHPAARRIAARHAFRSDEDLYIRESCLVYLEKACDLSCRRYLPELWPLLSERGLRFEAASLVVKVGGASGLAQLLRRLPRRGVYGSRGMSGLAGDIHKQIGGPALPHLRAALSSRSWPAKVLAIRALAHLGTSRDANLLDRLGKDPTQPQGWLPKTSIGEEASQAARSIRSRRQ